MKLKHLLSKFNGDFTVYYSLMDADVDVAIATQDTPEHILKKFLNKKVEYFTEGDFCIHIFIKK